MQCGLLACDGGAYQTAVLVTSHSACLKHTTVFVICDCMANIECLGQIDPLAMYATDKALLRVDESQKI